MSMTERADAQGRTSAQPVPMPISRRLIEQALRGAERRYPHSEQRELAAWTEVLRAIGDAVGVEIRARSGSLYRAGAPLAPGGERTKKRIKYGSSGHLACVAEPFAKLLGEKECEQMAREIILGRVLVAV